MDKTRSYAALNVEATVEAIALLTKARVEVAGVNNVAWAYLRHATSRLEGELSAYLRGA